MAFCLQGHGRYADTAFLTANQKTREGCGCLNLKFAALEKLQGATRLGATGLRASERENSEMKSLPLRDPLRGSRSCCPYSFAA